MVCATIWHQSAVVQFSHSQFMIHLLHVVVVVAGVLMLINIALLLFVCWFLAKCLCQSEGVLLRIYLIKQDWWGIWDMCFILISNVEFTFSCIPYRLVWFSFGHNPNLAKRKTVLQQQMKIRKSNLSVKLMPILMPDKSKSWFDVERLEVVYQQFYRLWMVTMNVEYWSGIIYLELHSNGNICMPFDQVVIETINVCY